MIRSARLRAACVAATLFAIIGCSGSGSSITSPVTSMGGSTGPAEAPAPATATGVAAPEMVTDSMLAQAVTLSGVIDGRSGGRLENEHVRLDVPAGAFGDSATITVTFPDPHAFVVELDIQPASLNHFAQPVELRLKCNNKRRTSTTPAAWWYNPSDSLWYGLTGSQYDSGGGDVRVQLRHFSRYGAGGKAGW